MPCVEGVCLVILLGSCFAECLLHLCPCQRAGCHRKQGMIFFLVWVYFLGSAIYADRGVLCVQWQDSDLGDEAKANARDLKHSAEQKGREIRDSWR